jgi:hypothetical protein
MCDQGELGGRCAPGERTDFSGKGGAVALGGREGLRNGVLAGWKADQRRRVPGSPERALARRGGGRRWVPVPMVVVVGVLAGADRFAGPLEGQWECLCATVVLRPDMVVARAQEPLELRDSARTQPDQGQVGEPRTSAQHGPRVRPALREVNGYRGRKSCDRRA